MLCSQSSPTPQGLKGYPVMSSMFPPVVIFGFQSMYIFDSETIIVKGELFVIISTIQRLRQNLTAEKNFGNRVSQA